MIKIQFFVWNKKKLCGKSGYCDMKTAFILCLVRKWLVNSSTLRKLVGDRGLKHILHRKFNGRASSTCIKAERNIPHKCSIWRRFWASDIVPVNSMKQQKISFNDGKELIQWTIAQFSINFEKEKKNYRKDWHSCHRLVHWPMQIETLKDK